MKKIKLTVFIIAMALGAIGAYKPFCAQCEYRQQYIKVGSSYQAVYGTFGVDYDCDGETLVCTYYKPNPAAQPDYYEICRRGEYIQVPTSK